MSWCRRCLTALVPLALAACQPQPPPQPPAPSPAPTPVAAPAPAPASTVHFAVYGDSRAHPEKHRAVIAQLLKLKPEFVLQTGDLVGEGGDQDLWKQFFAIVKPLQAACPLYPVMGNHDEGAPDFHTLFKLPDDPPGKNYYTFTRGNCRFVALDTNTLRLGRDAAQLAWVKSTLAAAKEPNLFVYLHHPPYATGSYAPGDMQVRRDLEPLFRAHPPRAVFCGHDHSYYRTTRHGIVYVVTAGGGAPLYEPNRKLMQPGDVSVKNYHGCEVTVAGEQVRLRAIEWDGNVIDDVVLPRAAAPVTATP